MKKHSKSQPGTRIVDRVSQTDPETWWKLVERSLCEIYHREAGAAVRLRKAIEAGPELGQLLFYNNEPLDIAAEVAGVKPTAEDFQAYKVIRDELYPELARSREPVE